MAAAVYISAPSGSKRKRFSAAELYNPTMVTTIVSKAAIAEAGEQAPEEEFAVQRALICTHSKYFEGAFRRQWAESKSRRVQIDDLDPKYFRMFMGWLFYQEIFYDPNRIELNPDGPNTGNERDGEPVCGGVEKQSVHDKPLRWEWMDLFSLYIFAEKASQSLELHAVLHYSVQSTTRVVCVYIRPHPRDTASKPSQSLRTRRTQNFALSK